MGDYPGHPFRGNQFTKGEGKSGRYDSYEEAAAHARDMATTHKMDVGIRRTKEYGKEGFNVAFLPKASHRYGEDLKAEVVRPGDPQSKFALDHIIKKAADDTYAANPARDLTPAPKPGWEAKAQAEAEELRHDPTATIKVPGGEVLASVHRLPDGAQAPGFAPGITVKQAREYEERAKQERKDIKAAYYEKEQRAKAAIESYNKATRPNVLRNDHESRRASQQARAAKGRLRRSGARYHETEDGKLRPGRKLSGRY